MRALLALSRPFACALMLALCVPAIAAQDEEEVLDEVIVLGEQPGPAMWKVSKGDHTLWIMGTLTPLPSKMTWRQRQAEEVIKASGEILAESTTDWDTDLGFWESIGLLRSAMRMRHNADGSTLREVLPPEVYERWFAAHRHWFGGKPDAKEKARPIYAAYLLYERALERSGLTERPLVWSTAERVARQHKVKVRQREFRLKLEDPKGLIAEISTLPRDKEVSCLIETMDYIEQELPDMRRRAQAWAIGDMAALRALPRGEPQPACMEVGEDTRFQQLMDREQRLFDRDWSGIVDWLLLAHRTSFTTLPIGKLLDEQGVLAQLRAKGYVVEEPR